MLHDRLLAHAVIERPIPAIDVTDPDWMDRYRDLLATTDAVQLQVPSDARTVLGEAIRRVGVLAVDRGALRIYGHLGRISHNGGCMAVRVTVLEADQ